MPDQTYRRSPRVALGLAALGLVGVVAAAYFVLSGGSFRDWLGGAAPSGPAAPAAPASPAAGGVEFATPNCDFSARFPGAPTEERITDRHGDVELPVVVAAYVDRARGVYYRIDCTVLGRAAAGLSDDELLARQLVSLLDWGESSHLSNIVVSSESSGLGQRARLHGTTTTRPETAAPTILVVDAMRYTASSSALHIVTLVPQSLYPLDSATRFLESVQRRVVPVAGHQDASR